MRVLVDLDSIIVSIEEAWYGENNRRFDDDLSIEKVTDWDVSKFSKGGQRIFEILREPGFFRNLPPLPGAIDGMRQLIEDPRFDVFIVGHVPGTAAFSEKAEWVERWLPELSRDRGRLFLTTGPKAMVVGDVLFDDAPHNLKKYAAAWPGALLATIAYPYNAKVRRGLIADRIFVAGHYTDTAAAWENFTKWLKGLA